MKFLRKFTIHFCIVLLLFFGLISFVHVFAEQTPPTSMIHGANEVPLDVSVSKDLESLLEQKSKATIFPLTALNARYARDCKLWLRSIQYYTKTRLGLNNLPFSLAVCDDGSVFEMSADPYTRYSSIVGTENSINIAYMDSENSDTEKIAKNVANILAGLGIQKQNIYVKDLEIELNKELQSMKFSSRDFSSNNYVTLLDKIKSNFPTSQVIYGIEIVSIKRITSTPQNGGIVEYNFSLKNNSRMDFWGENDITGGVFLTSDIPFDGKSTLYAGEDYWASFSRAYIIQKNAILKSGEQKDFVVRFKYSSSSGVKNFVITNLMGEKFFNTEFSIDVGKNVVSIVNSSISGSIGKVEILTTPTGYINVRVLPNLNSEIIGKVYPQKIYPLLETNGLWYRIDVGGASGWISAEYAKINN